MSCQVAVVMGLREVEWGEAQTAERRRSAAGRRQVAADEGGDRRCRKCRNARLKNRATMVTRRQLLLSEDNFGGGTVK